jgi:hypothetical protein
MRTFINQRHLLAAAGSSLLATVLLAPSVRAIMPPPIRNPQSAMMPSGANMNRHFNPAFNPYANMSYMYNNRSSPYGYGNQAYSPYGGSGYGMGYPASNQYGSGYQNPSSSSPYSRSISGTLAADQGNAYGTLNSGVLLTALGIPNEKGHVSWPIGLQVLSPAERNRELLQQSEALFQVAASQLASGQVDAQVVKQAVSVVDNLRQMLHARKARMLWGNYREAELFLNSLDANLKSLRSE